MRISRRRLLALAGSGLLALVALRLGVPRLMRARSPRRLGEEASAFVQECFAGIDRSRMCDGHVHLVGLGAGGTGCWINPEMQSHLRPIKRFQYDVYKEGVGMTREESADADYVTRLLTLHRDANPEGKLLLLAFDQHVSEDGTEQPHHSPFYTPDEYALELASRHPDLLAAASIHPYRVDALDRLDRAADGGARAVKWLPNAMGIDTTSPRCDAFYRRLAELRLPLITHAGKEYAVDAGQAQDLGNPLRLRRALNAGVRVVVAHCAGLGSYPDSDDPDQARSMRSFDLFMRLLGERQYESNLFADISALSQVNYGPRPLRELLKAEEFHHRLVYGSDYPMPALRLVISPSKLQLDGLLPASSVGMCRQVFASNPLLFDFVVKRAVRVEEAGRVYRFPARVFETDWLFG